MMVLRLKIAFNVGQRHNRLLWNIQHIDNKNTLPPHFGGAVATLFIYRFISKCKSVRLIHCSQCHWERVLFEPKSVHTVELVPIFHSSWWKFCWPKKKKETTTIMKSMNSVCVVCKIDYVCLATSCLCLSMVCISVVDLQSCVCAIIINLYFTLSRAMYGWLADWLAIYVQIYKKKPNKSNKQAAKEFVLLRARVREESRIRN